MKKIISHLLALGVSLTPVTVLLVVEPGWGHVPSSQKAQQAKQLLERGKQQTQQSQYQQAIQTFHQVLALVRELKDRELEALTLLGLGFNYSKISQYQQALDYYNQSLPLRRAVGDRSGEATTLNNIGGVYSALGEKQKALDYYNQSLPLFRAVGDRSGEARTLNNIGLVYSALGEKQKALDYFNQSLPLSRAVGDRSGEAITLGNLGLLYRRINQFDKAVSSLKQSAQIILKLRQGLQRQNRQKFLQQNNWSANYLVEVLIDQKQNAQAFEWVNLYTTTDLADYSLLINTKVANPQAQQALDNWNQKNQRLESLRQQLKDKFSDSLSQQIRQLETQVYQDAEDISRRFPEIAELLETTPTDIQKLQSSIPAGTVVVQPVLINNTIAIFVLTKDKLSVVKKSINLTQFNQLLTQYLQQLKNDGDDSYIETSSKLYETLLLPVEKTIEALSPKQLSIIATDKLRYLPFETLYDRQTKNFLLEKYPVSYLTRISTRSLASLKAQNSVSQKSQAILAFGNPIPRVPQHLLGAEEEVKKIAQLLPGSKSYLHAQATLSEFKTQAFRYPFLHLATHGCFQNSDCKKVKLKKNSLLFADTQFDIANAALLGLKGTQLLTLSACQTAQEIDFEGEGLAGVAYVFERAGAQAVMASLWAVEDKSTQELMVEFYQNLKQNMNKGEALRQAKLKQIDRHPFYWSSFVLIGDVR